MIRPSVDYQIKQLDITPPPSSVNSFLIIVDALNDDDVQLFPSVIFHISLRSLSLPHIRDLIQGQLIRRRWLGPVISTAATQLGFSSTELLLDPLVCHRWLSDYLAPHVSDLAAELGYGRNGFSVSIVVKIITQSTSKYEALSRMVQQGKTMNREELTSSQMQSEPCSICLNNLVFDDGSSSKHGVPTRMTCSHVFHDGCLLEWFQRKDTCPLCRTLLYDPSMVLNNGELIISKKSGVKLGFHTRATRSILGKFRYIFIPLFVLFFFLLGF